MTTPFRYLDPRHLVRRRLAGRKPPKWDAAILCFRDAPGTRALMKYLRIQPVRHRIFWSSGRSRRPEVGVARIGRFKVGVLGFLDWGGPQCAVMMEELGTLRIPMAIGYGAAGALVDHLPRGGQLAVHSAPAMDGTSRWYGKGMGRPDARLLSCARGAANALGISMHSVRAATTDAPYRETRRAVRAWLRSGAEVVNMESAAFYLSARACGVKALWLGHVSDRLLPGTWEDWHDGRNNMTSQTARLCRETLRMALSGRRG